MEKERIFQQVMKIATFGSRFFAGQLSRIDKGFLELGHELTENIEEADIVYCNNAWYDDILTQKDKIKGKIIFCVLDICPHCSPPYPIEKLKEQLKSAHVVVTISEYVQRDLKEKVGVDSTVIYQPQMGVFKLENAVKKHKVLTIGRILDPNKRTKIGVDAFLMAGYKNEDFAYVGNEYLGIGKYYGIVHTETELNEIYNSSEYVICSSKNEGLCLPCVECLSAGKIPIICNDLTTREELLPSALFPEYSAVEPNSTDILRFIAIMEGDNDVKEKFKERLYKHYKENLEEKFRPVSVAKRIIEVYNSHE